MFKKIAKKVALVSAGVILLASPLFVSADTLSDLQAQITALLTQLRALQAQMAPPVLPSDVSPPVPSDFAPRSCPVLFRTLVRGATGDDVKDLQSFLISQGLLSQESLSGFFGPLTEAAVQKWQSQNGIVSSGDAQSTGWGVFGSRSRGFLGRWCGGGDNNFSASPTSGQAPLSVTFTTSDSIANTATYSVDYGDNTSDTMTKGSCIGIAAIVGGQGGIRCSYSAAHTYSASGTYTAKLLKDTCPPGAQCFVGPQTVGTATIYVGTTPAVSFFANLTSGDAPLPVHFSAADCSANYSYTVYFGDGSIGGMQSGSCAGPGMGRPDLPATVDHSYTSSGTYTAILYQRPSNQPPTTCPVGNNGPCGSTQVGTQAITVGGTSNGGSLTANPTGGTAPLTVVFDTNLTDSTGGNYIIEYGDGQHGFVSHSGVGGGHTYQQPGTYVATLNAYIACLYSNPRCMIAQLAPLGSVTITVTGGTTGGTLTATPSSGAAPLTVGFSYPYSSDVSTWLQINFGDGSSGQMFRAMPLYNCPMYIGGGTCNFGGSWSASHTYTNPGTYTASVAVGGLPLCSTCTAPILGSATVLVTQTPVNRGILQVTPSSGPAPLTVTVSATTGDSLDWGDGSGTGTACAVSGSTVTASDGSTGSMLQLPSSQYWCGSINGQRHIYTSGGTFTVRLLSAGATIDSATVVVGGTSSGAPSISGLDAPTYLSVGQTGTWAIHASAPTGTQLSYSVVWGDESVVPIYAMQAAGTAITTTGTFTHAYSYAGVFNPTFTVSNSSGSAQTSSSVQVGSKLSCPLMMMIVDCAPGYHPYYQYDANGCQTNPSCVPDAYPAI